MYVCIYPTIFSLPDLDIVYWQPDLYMPMCPKSWIERRVCFLLIKSRTSPSGSTPFYWDMFSIYLIYDNPCTPDIYTIMRIDIYLIYMYIKTCLQPFLQYYVPPQAIDCLHAIAIRSNQSNSNIIFVAWLNRLRNRSNWFKGTYSQSI
jgi:hypothetical protein